MTYFGDFATGATVRIPWNTNGANGASITRATDGSIRIYKDSSTTERTSSNGVTSTEDFDSQTGMHFVSIDTSDNTDSGFYASGHDYHVSVSAATIDGQTVNAWLGSFSIENRSALRPTTAGRTLDVSSGGEAGVDWANVGSPTTTVTLSGTTVKTATDVEADTQDIQSRLPAALVGGRMDGSVGAYQSGLTPLQPTTAGRTLDVTATGEAGIDWANIGSPTTTVNLSGTTIKDATDVETKLGSPAGASVSADVAAVKSDTAAVKLKTDNLPSDPADASDIAASFSTVNTTLSTIAGYIDTEVAAIKAKTDNLPSDPADASDIAASFSSLASTLTTIASYIDTEVAAIKAKTDNLPASPAATSDIPSAATVATQVWVNGTRTLTDGAGIKKNTALNNFHFKLVDSSGNPVTSATVTATRMIDSGSFAPCANSATEASGGWYRINLANTDVNGDVVTFSFAAAGALTREITIVTEP